MELEIKIKNAHVNNLKDLSIDIPRNKVVVVTGVSGSGKSSLVFDTIYAEAQREFMDSLSTYSRISIPKISKPNVESIEGLSPCLVIDQMPLAKNPRSTVGTVTELYSYIRMLFSRMGNPILSAGEFSFNTPLGACECCKGLGNEFVPDLELLLDYDKSLNEDAIKHRTWKVGSRYWNIIKATEKFDMAKPLKDFSEEEMDFLLYSDTIAIDNSQPGYVQNFSFQGIIKRLIKRQGDSRGLESNGYDQQFFVKKPCSVCKGSRLNSRAREVKINGVGIVEVSNMEMTELKNFMDSLEGPVAEMIVPYISKMLQHIIDVGLGYLSISRSVATLSGGEAQKIKIAKQLGSNLSEIIYVMDEPTAGLHARDVSKIIILLRELVDKGNTVIIVEHNKAVIEKADYIIDIGPGAGNLGGKCIAKGSVDEICNNSHSLTGKMLKENNMVKRSEVKRRHSEEYIEIAHVKEHNLKDVTVRFRKNVMNCITGVSGSGKSTLVEALLKKHPEIIVVDQSAVGSNSRSNLVTYVQAFDDIRNEFARACNVSTSLFTFNGSGACEECGGSGYQIMDMHFLGEIKNVCPECNGKRYKSEVLAHSYKNLTIADALELTVAQAVDFFEDDSIKKKCKVLCDVGLDYLKIGQTLDTLSGGERQRLKLAKYMSKRGNIYVLDEPTRGLSYVDIDKLLELFNKLVDKKNTIILIEHNLKVIKNVDYIIDLGPDGGKNGGTVIVDGTPEKIAQTPSSYTGKFLAKEYFEQYGRSTFLNRICQIIRKGRPEIQNDLHYTIWSDTESNICAQIWVKTKGCKHTYTGGCTMCDYWSSPNADEEKIPEYLEEALAELKKEPEYLLLNTCGSVFDEWEMSKEIREKVLKRLAQLKTPVFILETHIETINEEKVKRCREIFSRHQLQFEMGFESSNWWIQKYCINKPLDISQIKNKIQLLKRSNITPIFNILVGIPFLSFHDMYETALQSIEWVLKDQQCNCVIFPINIKDWTLIGKMHELGLYEQPSLWLFIEVLLHIPKEYLEKVEIAWYKNRPKYIDDYKTSPEAPETCDKCKEQVMTLLDEFVEHEDADKRFAILKKLDSIKCSCRTEVKEKLKEKSCSPSQSLKEGYTVLAKKLLGDEWWEKNGAILLNSIEDFPEETEKKFVTKNEFLDSYGRYIRKNAKHYWDDNEYAIRQWIESGQKEGGIWFRTKGCTHEWSGGCTMCDYSFGSDTRCDEMVSSIKKALDEIKEPCKYLIITPSGSMFDEKEVPREALYQIMELFKQSNNRYFSVESRADTISLPVIKKSKEILGDRFKRVLMGLECSNPWILKYCINKNQDIKTVKNAIDILTENDIEICTNVLVGIPFLTPKENVIQAVKTTKWALLNGSTQCCIFPVHVKEYTHLAKLTELDLYESTSLWTYIEVILKLREEIVEGKVLIDWFETYEAYNIIYPAKTCDKCYTDIIGLLREFVDTKKPSILERLENYECECKEVWRKKYFEESQDTLLTRVENAYRQVRMDNQDDKWTEEQLDQFIETMKREYREYPLL